MLNAECRIPNTECRMPIFKDRPSILAEIAHIINSLIYATHWSRGVSHVLAFLVWIARPLYLGGQSEFRLVEICDNRSQSKKASHLACLWFLERDQRLFLGNAANKVCQSGILSFKQIIEIGVANFGTTATGDHIFWRQSEGV